MEIPEKSPDQDQAPPGALEDSPMPIVDPNLEEGLEEAMFPTMIGLLQSTLREPLSASLLQSIVAASTGDLSTSGLLSGQGAVVFRDGSTYNGGFWEGKLHGKGTYVWPDDSSYHGDFADNVIVGKGTFRWPDGSCYEGEVANGRRHGMGVQIMVFGSEKARYEGQWKAGLRHGQGTLLFDKEAKSYYQGGWENDKRHGFAVMRYHSGNYYQGEWVEDLRHGSGRLGWLTPPAPLTMSPVEGSAGGSPGTPPSNRLTVTALGAMGASNPQLYTGEWACGLPHGRGQHEWFIAAEDLPEPDLAPPDWPGSDGSVSDGISASAQDLDQGGAKEGEPTDDMGGGIASPSYMYEERTKQKRLEALLQPRVMHNRYTGEFAQGTRQGFGTFYYASGAFYQGEWQENGKEGRGVLVYEDGSVLEGAFASDRPAELLPLPTTVPTTAGSAVVSGGASTSSRAASTTRSSVKPRQAVVRDLQLEVDDLLSEELDPERAARALTKVVMRCNSDLRGIYNQYSAWTPPRPPSSPSVMDGQAPSTDSLPAPSANPTSTLPASPMGARAGATGNAEPVRNANTGGSRGVASPPVAGSAPATGAMRGPRGGPAKTPPKGPLAMTTRQFSRLIRECKLASSDLPQAIINRISSRATEDPFGGVVDVHGGDQLLGFRQFLEALVRIGHYRFSDLPTLSERTHKLLANYVLPYAARVAPDPVYDGLQTTPVLAVITAHDETLRRLFDRISVEHSPGDTTTSVRALLHALRFRCVEFQRADEGPQQLHQLAQSLMRHLYNDEIPGYPTPAHFPVPPPTALLPDNDDIQEPVTPPSLVETPGMRAECDAFAFDVEMTFAEFLEAILRLSLQMYPEEPLSLHEKLSLIFQERLSAGRPSCSVNVE